jgi:hypothetical protein
LTPQLPLLPEHSTQWFALHFRLRPDSGSVSVALAESAACALKGATQFAAPEQVAPALASLPFA